jgi:hypothetical protein
MELLGFHGMTEAEETLIESRLRELTYLPIDRRIEDSAIALRRLRRIKLPDALIAATALTHGLELLTLDEGLSTAMLLAR